MKQYQSEVEKYIKNPYYMGFVLLIAVLGYGFAAVHPTVNVDSIAYYTDYLGLRGDFMRSGRFGGTFWSILFGYNKRVLENTFSISVIGLLLLIWSGINYCILFQKASGNTLSMPAMTVFTACFISHPLMNEIWGYQGAIITICGGHLIGSFALHVVQQQLEEKKWNIWITGVTMVLTAVGIAGDESYVTVYVFVVLAVLLLQEVRKPDWKKHLCQGLWYCAFLIAILLVMVILRKLIQLNLHLTSKNNGATEIYWLTQPFGKVLRELILGVFNKHILTSVLYFPLLSTLICAGILMVFGLWQILRRRWFSVLLVLGMLITLEMLSIIQGAPAPLRACPTFTLLVSFVAMMTANILRWRNAAAVLLCFFCLHQSVFLNRIFTLNYLRYEQEKTIVHTIGKDLYAEYNLEKPVVFVGNCRLGSYVMDQVLAPGDTWGYRTYTAARERINMAVPGIIDQYEEWYFPQTNVQSVINWSSRAFDSQEQLQYLFDFFGYPFAIVEDFTAGQKHAETYVIENQMPGYPRDGYIVELEDRILVNLG